MEKHTLFHAPFQNESIEEVSSIMGCAYHRNNCPESEYFSQPKFDNQQVYSKQLKMPYYLGSNLPHSVSTFHFEVGETRRTG